MNKRKLWPLLAGPGLAVASLLLVFLLLDRSTASATPEGDGTVPNVRSPNATFTVSGAVTSAATKPISNVEVSVWDRVKSTVVTSDTTDGSGIYSVTLQAGNYDLLFHPHCNSRYASRAYKGITGPPDRTLDAVLSSGHTVSGTVFATNGISQVGYVSIYAFNHETADGFGLSLSDASGHYCIGLITGTYDLGFTPPPCRGLGPHTEEITITHNTPLSITLPRGFTVGGRVTNESANPVSGVQIYANAPDIGGFGFAPTNESGCYTGTLPYTSTSPTGTYDIQFIPPPGNGLGSVTEVDVVSRTAGCPNTTLPITLPAGYNLSGRVTCNGAGIKNVFIYALPEGPHDPDNSLPGYGVFTVDDGSYGLPLVSGTYTLTFTPPPAAGLNAKAFTTTQLVTNTVLDVDFCVCSGAWVTGTVDSDGDAGAHNSLALAPTYPYTPHISYWNLTTDTGYLKYACLSGATWLSQTVVSGGQQTSLALAQTYPYTPCISHHHWGEEVLKYSCREGITWTTMIVAGNRANDSSLVLEPAFPYVPHISYQSRIPWATRHAYLSSTSWLSGSWVKEYVERGSSGVGARSSLALESSPPYTPHISYYDGASGNLKYAYKSGPTWITETVDSAGGVGKTSLALDNDANPHISYYDRTNRNLRYAWKSGPTWITETVDSIWKPPWTMIPTSLKLDQGGLPHIGYYNATTDTNDLKYARFDGTVWIIQTVDSEGDVGGNSSLALDRLGCPHISYYDATNGDLKYAYILPHLQYLPLMMRDHP